MYFTSNISNAQKFLDFYYFVKSGLCIVLFISDDDECLLTYIGRGETHMHSAHIYIHTYTYACVCIEEI